VAGRERTAAQGCRLIQAERRAERSQLGGASITGNQNHSLRYAIHQLMQKIGMVAPSAHQIGNAKSAISPKNMKVIQKIFRCIGLGSGGSCLGIALAHAARAVDPREGRFGFLLLIVATAWFAYNRQRSRAPGGHRGTFRQGQTEVDGVFPETASVRWKDARFDLSDGLAAWSPRSRWSSQAASFSAFARMRSPTPAAA
jgi:hypothetical protein